MFDSIVEVFVGILKLLMIGTGYLICRHFKRDVDPDGWLVLATGLLFWIAVGIAIYVAYRLF